MPKRKQQRDPEILAKIAALQQQMQALVQEFKGGEDDADEKEMADARRPKEALDAELVNPVRIMLQDRPMLFADIVTETKRPENKIKAVLTKMQRDGELLINIGLSNRARWVILPPRVASRVLKRLVDLGVRSAGADDED